MAKGNGEAGGGAAPVTMGDEAAIRAALKVPAGEVLVRYVGAVVGNNATVGATAPGRLHCIPLDDAVKWVRHYAGLENWGFEPVFAVDREAIEAASKKVKTIG